MKKFTPHLLILIVGFLSLAFMASNALAQVRCEHLHQLSKKLHKQTIDVDCKFCACEKMEVYRIKHKIKASILQDCDCDETNDEECEFNHGHPTSDTGDFEERGCVWGDPSVGIPGDSVFTANITRVVKYCKDGDNQGSDEPNMPRAGYHQGTWRIDDSLTGCKLANGRLNGVDGVDPSFERPYSSSDRFDHHGTLPCDNNNDRSNNPGPDSCEGSECYIPGWQVGCLTGGTTDLFFRYQCPPPGSFTSPEVGNIDECPEIVGCEGHGIDNVIEDDRGKQICIDGNESWKIKACYSGGNFITDRNPCDQWDDDWCVRLEGVITIKACGNF